MPHAYNWAGPARLPSPLGLVVEGRGRREAPAIRPAHLGRHINKQDDTHTSTHVQYSTHIHRRTRAWSTSTAVRRDTSPNLFPRREPRTEARTLLPLLSDVPWLSGGSLIPWDPPPGDLKDGTCDGGMGTHMPQREISRVRQWTQLAAGSCGLAMHWSPTT